jgi:hypothetical protein
VEGAALKRVMLITIYRAYLGCGRKIGFCYELPERAIPSAAARHRPVGVCGHHLLVFARCNGVNTQGQSNIYRESSDMVARTGKKGKTDSPYHKLLPQCPRTSWVCPARACCCSPFGMSSKREHELGSCARTNRRQVDGPGNAGPAGGEGGGPHRRVPPPERYSFWDPLRHSGTRSQCTQTVWVLARSEKRRR